MFFHARTLEDGKKGCPGVMYFHARTFEDGKKGCPGVLHLHVKPFENGWKANYFVLYDKEPLNYNIIFLSIYNIVS